MQKRWVEFQQKLIGNQFRSLARQKQAYPVFITCGVGGVVAQINTDLIMTSITLAAILNFYSHHEFWQPSIVMAAMMNFGSHI